MRVNRFQNHKEYVVTRQQNMRLSLLAIVVLCILRTSALAAPTITANPNPVLLPPGQISGTTTLTWDGGANHPYAEVWVAVDNNDETFVVEQGKGSRQVTIELGKTYLYKLADFGKTLASITVTAQSGGAANAGRGATTSSDAGLEAEPYTGIWNTIAGGTHEYTVTLKQVGNSVTGSYSPGNGKIFEGVVVGNRLTFKWSQDGGYEGTGEFTLDENGKGFKGSSTALKPQQFTNTWSTFGLLSVAGVWETKSMSAEEANTRQNLESVGGAVAGVLLASLGEPVQFTLTLQQDGDKVTGTYTRTWSGTNFGGSVTVIPPGAPTRPQPEADKVIGKLEGTLTGNILRFKWSSDDGKGRGRFIFDKSEMAFNGTYSHSDDPEDPHEMVWTGTRKIGGGGGKTPVKP